MQSDKTTSPSITLLVGMIASGKSTYARNRAERGALIISHDGLTEMLHGEYRYEQALRETYRAMEESLVELALHAGRDVVIDRTHLTRESRTRWTQVAKEMPCPIRAVVFPVTMARIHAMRRWTHAARGRAFDEWFKVAIHHAKQWEAEPIADWQAEGFSESPILEGAANG